MLTGAQHALVQSALARAGAKWTPVYRQPADANGMPMGDPMRISCLLSLTYRKGNMASTLLINTPGTVLRAEQTRFEGITSPACPPIRRNDIIRIGGEMRRIIDPVVIAPGIYTLVLED